MKQKSNKINNPKLAKPNNNQRNNNFFNRYHYYFIAIFAFLLYANTLSFEYALDDSLMITENNFTKKGIDGIKDIFTNDAFTGFFGKAKNLVAGGRYRPLSQVMFAVEYQIFGLNPFIGHFINVIFFVLISLLLYLILRKLFKTDIKKPLYLSISFIATILFIAHPIHTEVVANIKGRDELLSLMFSLLALWFTLKYLETKKVKELIFIFLSFCIALFSKENAITFLIIIPLTVYYFSQENFKNYLKLLSPLLLSTIIFLIIRNIVIGSMLNIKIADEILNDPFINVSKATAIATTIFTWGKYLLLLIIPHPLTHDYYPFQIEYYTFSNPIVIFLSLFFIGIFIFSLWQARYKKLWSYAVLFAIITFSIQSNLIFNIGTFMNERFVFVPSIGISILLSMLIYKLIENNKVKKLVIYGLITMTLLYSVKLISRNTAWENDRTLFLTDINTSQNSIKCNVSAGGTLIEMASEEKNEVKKNELIQRAFTYLTKAQNLHSKNFSSWLLMGNGYTYLKDWSNALSCYKTAYSINKSSASISKNIIYVAQQSEKDNKFEATAESYRYLLLIEPNKTEYKIMLADAFSHINKTDSALIIIEQIIVSDPNNASAWGKKGEIYGRVYNKFDDAEIFLMKAIELSPDNLSANENLGIIYGIRKDFDKSLTFFERALKIDSTQLRLYQNIARTYSLIGNNKMAEFYINKGSQFK